ncbi:hypothetical protein CBS101457_002513 [Exobasidium rhododendri]|nr:hypothetical protein CBS101457_002513 [Exobasidium rhododendri]
MSFPTKLLSSTPTIQRDYAIVKHQIASSSQKQPSPLSRRLAERDEEEALEDSTDQDNLSNVSMPGETSKRRRTQSGSRSSRTSATNVYNVPADHHSRGGRSANLHGAISIASPEGNRRPSMAAGDSYGGYTQIVGIPSSYILGGQHMMPPADADLRSQDEIMSQEGDTSDVEYEYIDDEPTPRPMKPRTGWLSPTDQTPRPQPNRTGYLQNSAATESSPLLASYDSETPPSMPSRGSSWSKPGGANASGWDILQPGPPGQEELDEIAGEEPTNLYTREIRVLLTYLIPTWGTHILELSLNIVSVFSLGHLGVNELAASSLSSMTANVTGYSVIAGFVSALDSLLPGAYTSQPKTVGLLTQRMATIVAMMLPGIIAIWLLSEQLLLLLGQDPIVAKLAGVYLQILAIGLPAYAGFEICRRYLQAQGLFHAPTVVLLFVSPLNAFLNWLLVWGPDSVRLGFIGAPIASVISTWLMFLLCFAQCCVAPRVAWDGWTRLAFTGLKPIATIGFHGTVAMVSEWWSWEIVGLTTSLLGTADLAAQSVLLVSSSIVYQLPYALSVAAAVRVGNLLGALQPKQAKVSAYMALALSILGGAFNSALFLIFRSRWGSWFTADPVVIKLIYDVLPVLAAFQLADSLCGVASGILRGIGRQQASAVVNVTAYYAIGIPIGLLLTFSRLQWGLAGLWYGLTIALVYAAFFSCLIIKRADWDLEVQKTLERMGVHSQKPDDPENSPPVNSHI